MTPGARDAAVIEILDSIDATAMAADGILRQWLRERRYVGSKDRRAISDRVFGLLRRRGRLDAAIARLAGDAAGPGNRRRLLADLVLSDNLPPEELALRFDGQSYRPPPLDAAEHRLVCGLSAGDGLVSAAAGLPDWMLSSLRRVFGDNLEGEIAALEGEGRVDLRLDLRRLPRDEVIRRLAAAGISATPCVLSPWGVSLPHRLAADDLAVVRRLGAEFQDEGAQLVALLCGVRPGMTVIDYCAGAGGKALALLAAMEGQGRVIACDTDADRLARLAPRRERAAIGHATRGNLTTCRLPASGAPPPELHNCGDVVLLDVPCSGSGAWRRRPEERWRLTTEGLQSYVARQREIVRAAAVVVRPGGRLIYATCSVMPEENEEQMDWARQSLEGFVPVAPESLWQGAGLPPPLPALVQGGGLLLTPARSGTDGFFVAALERSP